MQAALQRSPSELSSSTVLSCDGEQFDAKHSPGLRRITLFSIICARSEQQFTVTKLLFARNFFRREVDVFVQNLLCHDFVSVETTLPTVAYCLLIAVDRPGIR